MTFDRYSGRRKQERSDLLRAAGTNCGTENREAAKIALSRLYEPKRDKPANAAE
jgi:hypothetical protein